MIGAIEFNTTSFRAPMEFESPLTLEPWKWLLEDAAQRLMEDVQLQSGDALSWTKHLRKQGVSKEHARLVVKQLTLRPLAERKFKDAAKMFFRRQLLEQATGENLAVFKAKRFQSAPSVVDFCCGLGGDLMALAAVTRVTGVDADPVTSLLAKKNTSVNNLNANVVTCRCEDFEVEPNAWVHIDPDRRAHDRRTTNLEFFSPSLGFLENLIESHPNCAIKLAPASRLPSDWRPHELQWLGDRRECKQLIAWFGETTPRSGIRSAVAVGPTGDPLFEVIETPVEPSPATDQLGDYLYEPHPTVIAGRLVDSIADQCDLRRISDGIAYLTGAFECHPALTRLEVLEMGKANRKEVVDMLNRHQAGPLAIKKRGVDQALMDRFAKLRTEGDQSLILVLTKIAENHVAIICRRSEPDSRD